MEAIFRKDLRLTGIFRFSNNVTNVKKYQHNSELTGACSFASCAVGGSAAPNELDLVIGTSSIAFRQL
jgi:hypothetical protein